MKKGLTEIGIILDRSGSMESIRDATISGFNEFFKQQKEVPGEAHVYAVKFDDQYEILYDGDIKDVPILTPALFVPRGMTALYDAMGKTIISIGSRLAAMSENDRPERIIIVTMTDGLENASQEFHSSQIAAMVKLQSETYKWEFVYMGANQNAILVGEKIGIPARNSASYAATAAGTRSTVRGMSANMTSYRSGAVADMAFSDKQREAAMDEDQDKKAK